MELDKSIHPAKTLLRGEDVFAVDDGQILKIETTPAGEERLSQGPPNGKRWTKVRVYLEIEEEDA